MTWLLLAGASVAGSSVLAEPAPAGAQAGRAALVQAHDHVHGPASIADDDPAVLPLRTLIEADDGRQVRVVLVNDGAQPITLLTRNTPFDAQRLAPPLRIERLWSGGGDVSGDVSVARAVPWQGRLAKRMPPGPDELVVLEPGESISAYVALDQGWHIESTSDHRVGLLQGWRTATLAPSELVARSIQRRERLDLGFVTQPAPAAVELVLQQNEAPLSMPRRARTPSYQQCSAVQQRDIFAATTVAERLVTESVAELRSLDTDELRRSPRYRTWFGAYDPDRVASVISKLSAVGETIAERQIGYNCDCAEPGVYAYVFPTRPYDIWLCPAFWSASLEGTDSRSGTVVHEVSHFQAVAGTSDHVYTHARAQDLADNDPRLAIDNADSFEYFVENMPWIPLRATAQESDEEAVTTPVIEASGAGEDSLEKGQVRRYLIQSGGAVTVESISGDADLQLYRGRGETDGDALCVSDQAPEVSRLDRCELTGDAPWTAVVVAFTDTRYRLSVAPTTTSVQERPSDDDSSAVPAFATGGGALGPWGVLLAGWCVAVRLGRTWHVGATGSGTRGGGQGGRQGGPRSERRDGRRGGHDAAAPRAAGWLLVAAATTTGCATASIAAPPVLDLSLEPVARSAHGVRVSLSNRSSVAIELLSWNTPFEPILSADLFTIESAGEPVLYTGRLVKRGLPAPDSAWIPLAPGESRSAELDLSRHYALDGEGPWTVELDMSRLMMSVRTSEAPDVRAHGGPITLRR